MKTGITGIVLSVCLAFFVQTNSLAVHLEGNTSTRKTASADSKTAAPGTRKTESADEKKASDASIKEKNAREQALRAFSSELVSKMPKGFSVQSTDYSGKTWIMNGTYHKPAAQVKKELSDVLRAEKYQLLHEIPLTADESRILISWKKNDVKLIFLLWKKTENETGFSWGKSK